MCLQGVIEKHANSCGATHAVATPGIKALQEIPA
jgi:hypothetical protein